MVQDCIFCGAPADSREHVWPEWIKNYLPRAYSRRQHIVRSRHTDFKTVITEKPGDPRSGRLNVTCERCNNGWISIVDANAKDVLLALMEGRWGQFTSWDRRVFAAWATRFAMVYEFADPPTVVATYDEREYLRLWGQPPKEWYIFVGYYAGTQWASKWRHVAATALDVAPTPAIKSNVQSTVAVIGSLVFNVVSGPLRPNMLVSAVYYATHFGLQILWPKSYPSFGAPANVFSDAEVDSLADFIEHPCEFRL